MRSAVQLPALALAALLVGACDGDAGPAPGTLARRDDPEVVFLVKNEVFGIRLDGTARRSFGVVGDDRHKAGYPRLLPDGRISVLADRMGEVFVYTTSPSERGFSRVGDQPGWLGDGACGVMVGAAPRLFYVATSMWTTGAVSSLAMRATTDGSDATALAAVDGAGLFGPAPDGDGHVLLVHAPLDGDDEIWRIDVSGREPRPLEHHEVIARVAAPAAAYGPGRLPDGRVVFTRFDTRQPAALGALWVVERDGAAHGTDIAGIAGAVVVGDKVVYEAGGGSGIADLIVTDLASEPRNLTQTPYISEHLGWDTEL